METEAKESKAGRRRPPSLLGPILLIGAGLILLGNTLGLVSWGIWLSLFRLWPIFLIAAGLDLLVGRRSIWGSLLATILVVAILVGAVWLSLSGIPPTGGAGATEISQPLGDATQADPRIDPSVGTLQLNALHEPGNLLEGTINLGRDEEIVEEFFEEGGRATYSLSTTTRSWSLSASGWGPDRVWVLGLSPGAALRVETSIGAGQGELDLRDLALEALHTSSGVGLTEVYLPGGGPYEVVLDGGVGVMTILVPEDLGVRLHVDSGLVVRDLPQGFRRQDENVYLSPDYESADEGVNLTVHLGVGIVQIGQW